MIRRYETYYKKKFLFIYAAFLLKKYNSRKNYISKDLFKYFKEWRVKTDNFQIDRLQVILEEKESLFNNMKNIKFFKVLKFNLKKKFISFIAKVKLYIQKKEEIQFIAQNYIFFENNYNSRLRNYLIALCKLEKLSQKNKKISFDLQEINIFNYKKFSSFNYTSTKNEQVLNSSQQEIYEKSNSNNDLLNSEQLRNFNLNEIKNKTFLTENIKGRLSKYFNLWKAKAIKNLGLIKMVKSSLINRLILFQDIINRKFLQLYSLFFKI